MKRYIKPRTAIYCAGFVSMFTVLSLNFLQCDTGMPSTDCGGCGSGGGGGTGGTEYDTPVGGVVTYADGVTPIAGAYVALVTPQGERLVVTSGDTGRFRFDLDDANWGCDTDFIGEKGPFRAGVRVHVFAGKIKDPITLPLDITGGGFYVVPGYPDQIDYLVTSLGYGFITLSDEDLKDSSNLDDCRYLLLESESDTSWADDAQVQSNLKSFVSDGGYLYVSDRDYVYVKNCWPDKVSFVEPDATIGETQTLTADVIGFGFTPFTPGLGGYLGKNTAEIYFVHNDWAVIDGVSSDTKVLLTGDPQTADGILTDKPLMVYFTHGDGMVIFTSFGYYTTNEDMVKTFEYVLSVVESRI